EPYVLKETCTVLRGERNREVSDLPDMLERVEAMAKYKKSMMRSSNYEFEPWKFDGDINHYHIPSYT
ncbi:hypothetical protein, partial [Clostridium botulinum]|uniref:hypothetical protein n=1 Tax=Clostridium botulinum TaxID=1491 RepID=UPI0009B4BCBA